MIKDWLLSLYPGKEFVVGSYAYLDGALHVQVSLAMDAISKALSEQRKASQSLPNSPEVLLNSAKPFPTLTNGPEPS